MKALLIFFSLFASTAYADMNFACRPFGETKDFVRFGTRANEIVWYQTLLGENGSSMAYDKILDDGSKEYSFLVDDSMDTRTYIAVVIRNENVVSAVEWMAGNDSDNYFGHSTSTLIGCDRK